MSGMTIMPGMIDMHAHIKPPKNVVVNHWWEFISYIAHGVTTIRDSSIDSDLPGWGDVYSYYDNIASGYMLGPRSFGAFAIVGTDLGRQINTQADARMFARRATAAGERSEERRVGNGWVSTCRSRWEQGHYKK